jgi:hypothetical protein
MYIPFNLTLRAAYDPVCEYGCNLCGNGLSGVSVAAEDCASQCVAEVWSWNYVNCLEQYVQTNCQ